MKRQHEPLRVPEGWRDQERSLVIQLDRILDNIYALVWKLEEAVEELRREQDAAHGESESAET